MQPQFGVVPLGIGHEAWVGQYDSIDTVARSPVNGVLPNLCMRSLWIGVQCQQHLTTAVMRIPYTGLDGRLVKVQTCKVAGVCRISKPNVHTVCTVGGRIIVYQ